jgi:putative phage-type endonuclease
MDKEFAVEQMQIQMQMQMKEDYDIDIDIDVHVAMMECIDDYVVNHVLDMSHPGFDTMLFEEAYIQLYALWDGLGILPPDADDDEMEEDMTGIVEKYMEQYYDWSHGGCGIPRRSQKQMAPENTSVVDTESLGQILTHLQSVDQPTQRTEEWYQFRHTLITASNLAKVFGSESQRNSLIYEKCKPLTMVSKGYDNVNTNSPMHWGQKYEPVSLAVYEHKWGTKVADFGCIRHPLHPFIGASPDGINVLPGPRYGRMLEIKNIVNRDITGIPSKAYWIQMQIQMETCDLPECDFFETRFIEYPENSAKDATHPIYADKDHEYRGIILHFIPRILEFGGSTAPKYVYMPLSIPLEFEAVETWVREKVTEYAESWSLYTRLYWYLAEYSLVLVERNRAWFAAGLPMIDDTWNTVLRERENGCEHRAPKKRATKEGAPKSVCLIKLDHE